MLTSSFLLSSLVPPRTTKVNAKSSAAHFVASYPFTAGLATQVRIEFKTQATAAVDFDLQRLPPGGTSV
jgi:hypothetical protein